MSGTKEKILTTALRLFARNGYEAVSVSMIAYELGITKGALYKHYKNKRAIFECIIKRMEEMDIARAKEYEMPEGDINETASDYARVSLDKIKKYTKAQFRYWTEEEFSSDFRKMLTLEQYGSGEMAKLYQQYLAAGPLKYMEDIFRVITDEQTDARRLALEFYGPVFLLYSVYDEAEDKQAVLEALERHVERFSTELKNDI